jgi:CarboxypepD_reg-like domain/TonB-dependent Receptor Plug Domain
MKRKFLLFLLLACTVARASAQQMTQTIRGIVIDKDSKSPLAFVNVVLDKSNPTIGAISDTNGVFILSKIPVGRQSLNVSFVGYKPQTLSDIQINVAKEIVLTIELEESTTNLAAITVTAGNPKDRTVNDMVGISGRTFSTVEANRFAGSQNDPSRMARNYAGVSGANDQRNDIIIRGNAPQGLLWRIEGIPVPNPNHFSGQGSTGGPISIINYKMLSNSDFLTGAFPAEYGNATSGVFDVKLRNGNSSRHEKTLQLGALGLETLVEGPLSKNGNSSYLIGYRYSTLSILTNLGVKIGFASIPYYQDGSAKCTIVTKKAGTFKLFGVFGVSNTVFYDNKADSTQFSPANKGENVHFGSKTGIVGLSHTYFFNNSTFIKTTLAGTYEGNNSRRDSIQRDAALKRTGGFGYETYKMVLNTYLNRKINAKKTLQMGFVGEEINYESKDSLLITKPNSVTQFWGFNNSFRGYSKLLQAYGQWKYKANDRFTLNSGVHFQYLTLNNRYAVEPRIAVNYQVKDNQTLSFGYGLHHQLQPYGMYFYLNKNAQNPLLETNKDLDFTRSNQFVAGYDVNFSKDFRLKVETYYQYLSNIPVEKTASSYSVLNYGATFANSFKENLVSNGVGQNYGLELTLEKFFSNNYYFLMTTSLYNSTYKGSDNIWRNTAFNGNYVVNGLAGYELKLKNNLSLLIDAKFTVAGGLRYSPIDIKGSIDNNEATYKNDEVFTLQNKTYVKPDVKITIRKNFKRKLALEWALDIQNVSNTKNVYFNWYDKNTQREHTVFQNGRFPTVQLKLEF